MSEKALRMGGKAYALDVMPSREKIGGATIAWGFDSLNHRTVRQTGNNSQEVHLLAQLVAAGTVTRVR
ncbi:MAG: hypothetical protein A2075_18170 [Geobacteraceae bacterium GWC2_58_44]|nr:MAG: hypothetical protein A2075_18170 [Geobacteraceae bacterium GWC2_58_44]HBG05449.1 hypothetical protein [Geobacter sp.]